MCFVRFSLLSLALLTLCGCSSLENFNPFSGEHYEMKVEPILLASRIYDQGLAKLAIADNNGAAKKFADLGKQYPGSDWARKGLLMTAYAQFQGADYDDAAGSAMRYVKDYPKSADAPYALYLQAESHYAQILDISRDQDHAVQAFQLYTQLLNTYPNSEYAKDSKIKVQMTADQLAGKEMSIGRFYLHQHNFIAAINRFHVVLGSYQTTRHTEEALYRLVEAYLGLGLVDEAETAAAVLGHNFPSSEWYQDAYALLKTGGHSPQMHEGSWIPSLFGIKS